MGTPSPESITMSGNEWDSLGRHVHGGHVARHEQESGNIHTITLVLKANIKLELTRSATPARIEFGSGTIFDEKKSGAKLRRLQHNLAGNTELVFGT